MPKRRYVATNRYGRRVPDNIQIEVRRPAVKIDRANYRYLQMLDAI